MSQSHKLSSGLPLLGFAGLALVWATAACDDTPGRVDGSIFARGGLQGASPAAIPVGSNPGSSNTPSAGGLGGTVGSDKNPDVTTAAGSGPNSHAPTSTAPAVVTATPPPAVALPPSFTPTAVTVSVLPVSATIGAQPAVGLIPFLAPNVRLVARVLMSNGGTTGQAQWSVTPATIASVSVDGMATGLVAGTCSIVATSLDGRASASAAITVKDQGGAAVTIQ